MPPSSRIRVLFVIGSMGGGGAERQVVEILKRLDRTHFEPMLYLVHKQGELLSEVPADVPIHAYWDGRPEPFIRRVLSLFKLTRLLRHFNLARILRENQIDVVYDRTYLASLDSAGGCTLRPTPRISCCVADPDAELRQHSRISIRLSWWFARRAYQAASVVLANSNGLRQRMIDYFRLSPDHVRVFYNLLPDVRLTDDVTVQEIPIRQRLAEFDKRLALDRSNAGNSDHTNQPFLIVSSGRLHREKGYHVLLAAVDELVHRRGRDLKLVVFGIGEAENELREFIRTHRLESHVLLAGFVAEPRRWYPQADLFVLPSLNEGMPNALIEAVACGVPVLSTNCPSGPNEILDEGRCGGLVAVGNAFALADGIADAIDHTAEWQSRVPIAMERVKQMFDPQVRIRKLEEIIEQIAK